MTWPPFCVASCRLGKGTHLNANCLPNMTCKHGLVSMTTWQGQKHIWNATEKNSQVIETETVKIMHFGNLLLIQERISPLPPKNQKSVIVKQMYPLLSL